MTEAHCDAYLAKIAEIRTACADYNTDKVTIETKRNELADITTLIDADIAANIALPTTIAHFDKFVRVQISRARNAELQSCLYNLLQVREAQRKALLNPVTGDYDAAKSYEAENAVVTTYVNETQSACNCMSDTVCIVTHLANN